MNPCFYRVLRALRVSTPPLLIFVANGGLAQTDQVIPSTSESTYIEELTVVGERDKETLADESHSVAVFNSEVLELSTQRTFSDLFEQVPNTTTNQRGEPVIRGIPQFGIDNGTQGAASTTTFFRDGLGVVAQPVLWDAETAEVSRGPQNELRPSIGGSLAIGTTDPTDRTTGRARVGWAPEANDRELGIALGGQLTSNLSGRVSAYDRTDDGHIQNTTRNNDSWDSFQESLGRVKLLWQPAFSPNTKIKFLGEYIDRERGGGTELRGSGSDPLFDPFDRRASVDADVHAREKVEAFSVDIAHEFGSRWLINLAAGWNQLEDDSELDGDGTSEPLSLLRSSFDFEAIGIVFIALYQGDDWLVRFRQRLTRFDSTLTQDNISALDLDGPGPLPGIQVNTQVQVPWPSYYGWTTQLSAARSFGPLRFATSLTYEGDTTGEDISILSAALTRTNIPPLDAAFDATIQQFFPQVVGELDTDSADILPMLSLSYSLDDRSIVGAKWERARRAGGVTVNLARSEVSAYDPEQADNFDLFFRATRFDGRLSIGANIFYTRTRDLQLNAMLTTTPSDNQIVNAERAESRGLEFAIDWTQGNWSVFANAGLLSTRLDDVRVGITDFNGNRYPFAPRWNAVLGANYSSEQGLFGAFDFSVQPESLGSFDNRRGSRSDSRQLLNARIGWRWNHYSLSFYGRNLLDDEYHNFRDLDLPLGQNQVFNPGDPREGGITFEVEW